MLLEQMLIKLGLKREDLNEYELETYNQWVKEIDDIKEDIPSLKLFLEKQKKITEHELTEILVYNDKNKFRDTYLKMYLRTLKMLIMFFEQKKTAIQTKIQNIKN